MTRATCTCNRRFTAIKHCYDAICLFPSCFRQWGTRDYTEHQAKRLKTNAGTAAYMAPEQLMKKPLDHRADQFAFGVTMYEILTFRKPYDGNTVEEVLRRQMDPKYEIPPPRSYNKDIPIAVQNIVMKCLNHDPEKRYIVTTQLVKELHKALYI